VSTVVIFPAATETQVVEAGIPEVTLVHDVPLREYARSLVPDAIATKLPPAPCPSLSKACIAPVTELTAVIVIVISLVVDAPPKLVPEIVIVSNLS